MIFYLPALLMRKKHIIKKLQQCGATSEATAKTLSDTGVFNPNAFTRFTEQLVKERFLGKTDDVRYYLL